MCRSSRLVVFVLASLSLTASALFAQQASIAGVIKDTSGALMPGVTVEVASPALIEKTRSVVSDGSGQYRVVDLRPGTYAVAFTLSGFTTVKREGIELTGSFTATVNAELRVGSIAETITVTGETPVVDVQGVTQQRVLGSEVLAALPTGRSAAALGVLIPGIQSAVSANGNGNPMDVGGVGSLSNTYMTIHGSNYLDQRLSVDGIQVRNILGSGNANNFAPDISSTQEVTIDVAAGSVEQFTGGVRVNFVPREGANRFKGSFFATGENSSFQSNNITQDLRDRGLADANGIDKQYDIDPSFGGPIAVNTLWFYTGARVQSNQNYLAGMYENVNAGDSSKWTYVPDFSKQARFFTNDKSVNLRLTWQAAPKHKVNFYYLVADRLWQDARPNFAPEAFTQTSFPKKSLAIGSWSSPVTSRLLVEARVSSFADTQANNVQPHFTQVVEQAGMFPGLTYRGSPLSRTDQPNIWEMQLTSTYVTGAHAFKVGVTESGGTLTTASTETGPLPTDHVSYRFNNGEPNQLTERSSPNQTISSIRELGVFLQDKWTVRRLTLTGGLRYDHLTTSFPEQTVGPALLAPTRNVTFQETSWDSLHDISPRFGAAYDLFGTGKTAVKVSLGKYLGGYGAATGNPVAGLSQSTTRTWTDLNHNLVPDCDLTNPLANGGECGAMANSLFGTGIVTTSASPETVTGWGKRLTNSEFSASVQHEIVPQVGVNVGYFYRWFGAFVVTDNLATTAADYSPFSITAPIDARLPGGGGYVISGLYNLNPNRVGAVDNQIAFADDYGTQLQHWAGIDASVNLRLKQVLVQAVMCTGRTLTDNCQVMAQLPEIQASGYEIASLDRRAVSAGVTNNPFCRVETPFLTQFKAIGTYTVPRADVLIAATMQSFNGVEILANQIVPNAQVAPSLGRPLSGGAANVTVPLIAPGTMYGDRTSMLDLRIGKILRFGRLRTTTNLDIYNAFNASTVTQMSSQYANWLTPQAIIAGRLFKISVQADF